MSVIIATDIAVNGEARLLPQFSQSTKLKGLLKSLLGGAQSTEETLFQIMSKTGIDTAEGAQLDNLGKLVGSLRGGQSDTAYRSSLYAKVSVNSANGTPEGLMTLVRLATGSQDVLLHEYFPAEAHIQVKGGTPLPTGFLDLVTPAGVGTYLSTIPDTGSVWVPSEEDDTSLLGVLPEEGNEAGFIMAEDIN